MISLCGAPAFSVMMPFFGDTLGRSGRGAETMGFLLSASGVGALIAAIYLTLRRTVLRLSRVVSGAAVVFALSLIAFAFSPVLWISLPLSVLAGLGMVLHVAGGNTMLQSLIDDEKRGRVMGFFVLAYAGMAPFGNGLVGSLATHMGSGIIGARRALVVAGLISLLAGVVYLIRLPALRRIMHGIYTRKGIIPAPVAPEFD